MGPATPRQENSSLGLYVKMGVIAPATWQHVRLYSKGTYFTVVNFPPPPQNRAYVEVNKLEYSCHLWGVGGGGRPPPLFRSWVVVAQGGIPSPPQHGKLETGMSVVEIGWRPFPFPPPPP